MVGASSSSSSLLPMSMWNMARLWERGREPRETNAPGPRSSEKWPEERVRRCPPGRGLDGLVGPANAAVVVVEDALEAGRAAGTA